MSLAIVRTRALVGIHAPAVNVETHLSNGLPAFTIVGMPETCVKESKDRVRSAILNSHFEFPQRRITVNLAPADLPKDGSRFDLAIALGILAASDQIPADTLDDYEFIGELALSGELRHCRGTIPVALATQAVQKRLIAPQSCGEELVLCTESEVFLANNLLNVCAHLHQRCELNKAQANQSANIEINNDDNLDMSDICGQDQAKRALLIAASGGHNLLLFGPPGSGKSMLASRLPSILPPLDSNEALEVLAIQSVVDSNQDKLTFMRRPFRSPHHTASAVSLVGGGSQPRPGEISLAHNGVLFLDELPEYKRSVLEVLREPLESGHICISRAAAQVKFPTQFQLVAAMNPCSCGYYGDGSDRCTCSPANVLRYKDKISGPLLDRIDMQVFVPRISPQAFSLSSSPHRDETSSAYRERVVLARDRAQQRQQTSNAQLAHSALKKVCELGSAERELLLNAVERFNLSARSYDRILRVARTIADLDASETIEAPHLSEALSYRNFDRFYSRLARL